MPNVQCGRRGDRRLRLIVILSLFKTKSHASPTTMVRPLLLLLILLLAVVIIGAASIVHGKTVTVHLTVDTMRFDTPDTPISFNTRAYNGRYSGPLIRVAQGDSLHINVVNKLTADIDGPVNTFRLANTTNLHLHGLHMSPNAPADDVFRRVLPNSTASYVYEIPSDHTPGTYWYHPHVHGSSSNQQGGGMAGALVVGPADPVSYFKLSPALFAMEEEILLLQHLCFHNDGKYQSSTPYINHLNVVAYGLDNIPPNPKYKFPNEAPDYYMVNGKFQPNITMAPGEFKLFRLIGAGTNAFLELQIVDSSSGKHSCDIYVVAKDGIYVPSAYEDQYPLLVPGSRIDLAVRCNQTGYYHLASQANAPAYNSMLEESTVVFEGNLAGLHILGTPVTMSPPSVLPARPAYLPDLRNITVSPSNEFSLVFETVGGPIPPGPPFRPMHINQQSFATKDTFITSMQLGSVHEWSIGIAGDSNMAAGNHPFHMHVNPFQVVDIGSGMGTEIFGIRVGEYRDTLPLSAISSFRIRFIPDRFTGRALIHCHTIPHVDLGMGAVANITTGK